ncbi:MAG: biopolymer transporter ExbD [Kiritimatiellae bacterium]|jgi:biopolymer transport protein ExbD|nr:biopolymer transporter ExbD [Kiritimatiellia bacterium]
MSMLRKTQAEAEVSMSPLIDAVFLLLIFFLVATMIKKEDKDIDIDLPMSTSALEVKPDDDVLVIGIDEAETIYLEGETATVTELLYKLREISVHDPDRRIRLDTDKDTQFHKVVEVLNLLQFRNLSNVGIRTYDEHYNR